MSQCSCHASFPGRCMASDRRFLVGLRAADRPKLAPRRDDDASDDDDDDDDDDDEA